MVRGLERFKAHFAPYIDHYVLIGGAACSLLLDAAGLGFRSTKDLDIVLTMEGLNREFVQAFWSFVKAGHYQNQEKSTGKSLYYRFQKPDDETYPVMLELFSRLPDTLTPHADSHLTPIPMEGETSSLSAILLDGAYYHLIQTGKGQVAGLPIVMAPYLIPLKAKAWLDLSERREIGHPVDERSIRKHRNDVFRLYQIVEPDRAITLPEPVKEDLRKFLQRMEAEPRIDLRNLGFRNTGIDEVLDMVRVIYELGK